VLSFFAIFFGHFSSLSILENSRAGGQAVSGGDTTGQIRQYLTGMKQLRVSSRAGREYPLSEEYVEQSSICCSLFWHCKHAPNGSAWAALSGKGWGPVQFRYYEPR
jgi:hypothetical protein